MVKQEPSDTPGHEALMCSLSGQSSGGTINLMNAHTYKLNSMFT